MTVESPAIPLSIQRQQAEAIRRFMTLYWQRLGPMVEELRQLRGEAETLGEEINALRGPVRRAKPAPQGVFTRLTGAADGDENTDQHILRRLYIMLVKQLHPDAVPSHPNRTLWLHAVQSAYQQGDGPALRRIASELKLTGVKATPQVAVAMTMKSSDIQTPGQLDAAAKQLYHHYLRAQWRGEDFFAPIQTALRTQIDMMTRECKRRRFERGLWRRQVQLAAAS